MFSLTLLWILSLVATVTQVTLTLMNGTLIHPLFPIFVALSFLPLWTEMMGYILRSDEEKRHELTSPIFIGILIIAGGILWFHPSIFTWLLLMVGVFALFRLIDARILFLIALTLLGMIPLFLILGEKSSAEAISIFLYYSLVIGTFCELASGSWMNMWERVIRPISLPKILRSYLDEMRSFSRIFITWMPLIFIIALIYSSLQDPSWSFTLRQSTLEGMVFGLFICLLFTPRSWKIF